jgi:predicted RNase H-like nuclease (RuvC/YqgF family)
MEKLNAKVEEKEEEIKSCQGTVAQLNSRIDFLSESFTTRTSKFEATIRQLTTSLEGTQNQLAGLQRPITSLRTFQRLKRRLKVSRE